MIESPPMKAGPKRNTFTYYLLALSLVGMGFVFIVTYRFGPGLSTDGAKYLSTAENLINGRGFYDYLDLPLTQFPPLYPILIAGVSFITGADVFVVGQYLNILTFGLVIWLAGAFLRRIFPDELIYAYVGSAVFATSISLIRIASNILSDLLFLAITIVFLIAATHLLENLSKKNILLVGAIACISPFQRYAGLALILTGAVIIFILYRREILKAFLLAGTFGFLASLPIFLWVILHNYLRTGILFGLRSPPSILGNIETTLDKAIHWFLPYSLTDVIPAGAIFGAVLLIVLTGNRLADWKRWLGQMASPSFLPSLIFLVFYTAVLVFNVSYSEVRWPFMDRIHIIILPALMALGFLTIKELLLFYLRRLSSDVLHKIAIIVFLLWLSYPLYNLQNYLRSAYYEGEISEYNLYNTRIIRESGIEEHLKSLPIEPDQIIYSNYEPVAWFFTRRSILTLPRGPVGEKKVNPEEVLKDYPNWPESREVGYVVWMKTPDFKPYVLSPEQLTSKADFELSFLSRAGNVYILIPK
jgi:hypothetical protein